MATTASSLPTAEHEFQLTKREKVFTLAGTLMGMLLAALDQTIVATAGPAIQRDLQVTPALYPWITTAYLVASTVMVPIYGKLSDLYGRRPILLAGIGLFLAGSLACGLSTTTLVLILSRALQGLGSAALFTSAFAVVADIFAPADRGKYQGLFGACFALSSVVGPLVGGFLTDQLSWHWVFFVNLPLGAVAIAFVASRMPLLRRPRRHPPRIDYAGACCLSLSVVPFLVALSLGRSAGPGAAPTELVTALVITSGLALVGFIFVEGRAPEPLLDLRLFENRVFTVGNLTSFIMGAAFLAAIVFLPLFMVNVVGLSATAAGLTLIPLTFGIVGGSVLSGQIVARVGRYKPIMLIGNSVMLVGYALLAFGLRPDSSPLELTLKMVVLGIGLGPAIPLYTLAIQNAVEPRDLGVATASATFFRQIGATMGVSGLGLVFAVTLAGALNTVSAPELLKRIEPIASREARAGEHGESVLLRVDVARYAATIRKHAAGPHEREAALAALESFDRDTKAAVTRAIQSVFRWGLVVAALGFLTTLALPAVPLRRRADSGVGAASD